MSLRESPVFKKNVCQNLRCSYKQLLIPTQSWGGGRDFQLWFTHSVILGKPVGCILIEE